MEMFLFLMFNFFITKTINLRWKRPPSAITCTANNSTLLWNRAIWCGRVIRVLIFYNRYHIQPVIEMLDSDRLRTRNQNEIISLTSYKYVCIYVHTHTHRGQLQCKSNVSVCIFVYMWEYIYIILFVSDFHVVSYRKYLLQPGVEMHIYIHGKSLKGNLHGGEG